jgi:heme/copper-type cytochrome/quinol oxidase subunit 3
MKHRSVEDVSGLPTHGFGSSSPIWWGTAAFIAIEGMGFALAGGTYLYLAQINPKWPIDAPLPNHWPGTLITLLLLASVMPNVMIDRAAREENLTRVRILLLLMTLIGAIALAIRAYEFQHLNVGWDTSAYGSIQWLLLGLHATHLLTDVGDTVVLTALMFTRHVNGRRFSDVSDNAFYWHFVVAAWLPLYGLIYWVPRL